MLFHQQIQRFGGLITFLNKSDDSSDDERDRKGKGKGKGGRGRDDSDEEEPMPLGEGSSVNLKTFSSSQFEKTSEYDYLFKILLLGSQGVGKSSLLGRFAVTILSSLLSNLQIQSLCRIMNF